MTPHKITQLPGQSWKWNAKIIRSKCNKGCDWCIYVTVDMYSVSFYCLKNCYTSDICHLFLSEVGVNTGTDILSESDGCHYKLPLSH